MRKTTEQRFWEKVDKTEGCWLWTSARLGRAICNYGLMSIKGKHTLAHRISYELTHGSIPPMMNVLHRCDNPICVNPDHLFLGTQADNMADMSKKKRGSKNGRPRPKILTPEQTASIQESYIPRKCSQRHLAHLYGVSQPTIRQALKK
jgi:hypothetical protein